MNITIQLNEKIIDILLSQAGLIEQTLKEMWEMHDPPSFLKLRHDLALNKDFIPATFNDVLAYLIEEDQILIDIDANNIIRIYDPYSDEVRIKKIAVSLFSIIEDVWKNIAFPTIEEVRTHIPNYYSLSDDMIFEALILLKQFRMVEIIKGNNETLRICKPQFYDNMIENITLWTFEENEQ